MIPDKMVREIAGIYRRFECAVFGLRKATVGKTSYNNAGGLDFADDIALPSSKFNDLFEKNGRLAEEAARVGLKLNVTKCKALRTEGEHCGGWRRSR